MECYKYTISNLGSEVASFNYQKCSNSQWEYNVELLPNESKNIWALDGSFNISNFFESSVSISSEIFSNTSYNDCVVFFVNCIYEFLPNTTTPFTQFTNGVPLLGSGVDIANTTTKLWTYKAYTSPTEIYEYNITLSPFTISYNRTITIPNFSIGAGLEAISNTTLLTTTFQTGGVVEIDITNSVGVVTPKFLITGVVAGDLLLTTDNVLYVTTTDHYLRAYNYSNGALIFQFNLFPQITQALGLFVNNNSLCIANGNGQIWKFNPPSGLVYVQNANVYIAGASTAIQCNTITNSIFNINLSDGFGPYPAICDGVSGPFPNSAFVNTLFWPNITKFYSDSSLTTGFNGNNLWYGGNSTSPLFVYNSCTYQIDSDGNVIDSYCC